jgi:Protein of unknown function (DUF2505)
MRFSVEQRYEAGVDDVITLFADPDFYPTLTNLPKISTPEVVDHRVDGHRVHISLRQRFIGDLPGAALAVIDPTKLSWVEMIDFDLDRATADTHLVPDHYGDRLSCRGHYVYVGDGDASTLRRLDGELKVRVALVGGRVEQALVSGLTEHADAEAALVRLHLATLGVSTRLGTRPKKPKAKHKGKAAKDKDKAKDRDRDKKKAKG